MSAAKLNTIQFEMYKSFTYNNSLQLTIDYTAYTVRTSQLCKVTLPFLFTINNLFQDVWLNLAFLHCLVFRQSLIQREKLEQDTENEDKICQLHFFAIFFDIYDAKAPR